MRYRVRRLEQRGKGTVDEPTTDSARLNLAVGIAARSGAVFEVEAADFELDAEQIREGLRKRELKTTDLLVVNQSWVTIAEAPEFEDFARSYARAETLARNLRNIAWLVLAIAVAVLGFALPLAPGCFR